MVQSIGDATHKNNTGAQVVLWLLLWIIITNVQYIEELNVSNNNNNITDEKSIGKEFKTNDTLKY